MEDNKIFVDEPYKSLVLGSGINLKALFSILWSSKMLILSISSFFAIFSVIYTLSLSNIYTSSALLKLSQNDENSALSSIGSNFSGLASLAGVSIPTGGNDQSEYAMKTLMSREFVKHISSFDDISINLIAADGYDDQKKVITIDPAIYDQEKNIWVRSPTKYTQVIPTYLEIHKKYVKSVVVNKDKISGFITISFQHYSPIFAKDFIDLIIQELNNIARERNLIESKEALQYLEEELEKVNQKDIRDSINKLIATQLQTQMFSNIKNDYLLETIDAPFIPEMKSAPSRALLCIAITFFGMLISVMTVLIRYNFKNS